MINNPSNPGGRKGTGFTNLASYLQANKQNKLGQTIGSGVGSAANQVSADLSKSSADFATDSAAGNLDTDVNRRARESVLGRIAATGTNTPGVSDDEVKQFGTYLAGQYKGPRELADQTKLNQQAQRAESLGNSLNTQSGRTGLLQQFVGGPQYTQGQQKLDTVLLGQQNAPLAQAKQKTVGLSQAIGRENQKAGAQASQLQNQAQQFSKDTGTAIQGQKTSVADPLQTQLGTLTTAQEQALARIRTGGQTGEFSAADASMLGLESGQDLYDVDVSRELKNTIAPTLGGLASDQQKAQIAALAKLSGQDVGQFYKGFDPTAAKFDPNKLVSTRDDFKEFVQSRGQEAEKNANNTVVDLSGAIKRPGDKFNSTDPNDPYSSWMGNPAEFKDITIGGATQRIKDTESNFNSTILPQLYKEAFGKNPAGPITLADLAPGGKGNKLNVGDSDRWRQQAYNYAKEYMANIDHAKQQIDAQKAKIPMGKKVKIV